MAKNLAIHVLLTYIIEIKFAKHRLSTLGRGLREMALKMRGPLLLDNPK